MTMHVLPRTFCLSLALLPLTSDAWTQDSYFSGRIRLLDVSTFEVKPLDLKGFPILTDPESGIFYLLTGELLGNRFTLQKVSLDGAVLDSAELLIEVENDIFRGATFSLSPDGRLFAYYDLKGRRICMIEVASGNEKMCIPAVDVGVRNLHWLNDRQLLYECPRRFGKSRQPNRLETFDVASGKKEVLYEAIQFDPSRSHLAIDRKTKRLVFVEIRDVLPHDLEAAVKMLLERPPVLVLLDLENKETKDLGKCLGNCSWSADGERIAYVGTGGNIVVKRIADNAERIITKTERLIHGMRFVGNRYVLWNYKDLPQLFRYDLQRDEKTLAPSEFGATFMLPYGDSSTIVAADMPTVYSRVLDSW